MQLLSKADTFRLVLAPLGSIDSARTALARRIASYDSERAIRARTTPPSMAVRTRSSSRSVRSAVRQTFSARKAAKATGGGSSDPDGRPRPSPSTCTSRTACSTRSISAFLLGGAAK